MSYPLGPSPGSAPKQLGAIGGLYDKPAHRDWLVYWTLGWAVFAGLAIAFPTKAGAPTTSMPTWLNALLAAVFFGALLGVLPAYLRLLVRRRRLRSAGVTAEAPPRPVAPPRPAATSDPAPSESRSGPPPQAAPSTRRAPEAPSHPAPITVLDLSGVRNSEILTRARKSFPYPIARGARAVQSATDHKNTYEAAIRTAEMVSVVLGITAVTWARGYGVSTAALTELHDAFDRGVSQGLWAKATASMKRSMQDHPDAIPGMVDALRSRRGDPGLLADLAELVEERNRWAHGSGPQNRVEAAERLGEVLPPLERSLDRIGFLAEVPWILVKDLQLRRREGDFQVHAARAMGDHPDFEDITFATRQALAEDVFYLRTPSGMLDMTPLVVMRPCPTCHQPEVAYADRVDQRKGVVFKTFDRGHQLFDTSLVDEIRDLIPAGPPGGSDRATT